MIIRVEIIANHSVEENIFEALAKEQLGKHYTKFPSILGAGSSGLRMGDSIWPEENFALVIWCELEEALRIKHAVAKVKEQFPDEGIKFFSLPEIREKPAASEPERKSPAVEPRPAVNPAPRPASPVSQPANPTAQTAVEPRPTANPAPRSASPVSRPEDPAVQTAAEPRAAANPAPRPANSVPQPASSARQLESPALRSEGQT
ncbi:MAG: hypothetical protein LBK62_07950 [Treponema sp.]|jgi:hypothetical protein|nr:hypothetical protein [Treponema sp.]